MRISTYMEVSSEVMITPEETSMASDNPPSILDTTVQCGICFHSYDSEKKVPRILHDRGNSRTHVMCTECIQSYRRGKEKFPCPECRREVTESPEDLPVYTGEGIGLSITTVKSRLNTVITNKGEICTECDDSATFICFDCETYLCEDCKQCHKRQKKTKDHNVKEITSLTDAEKNRFQPVSLCDTHNEAMDMYCIKCETACCRKCDAHLQHGFKPLRQVLTEQEDLIKGKSKTASDFKKKLEYDIENLRDKRSNSEFVQRESVTQIENLVTSLCEKIRSEGADLLEKLNREHRDVLAEIDQEITRRGEFLEVIKKVDLYFTKESNLPDMRKLELFTAVKEGLASLPDITRELNIETGDEVRQFIEDKSYSSYVTQHSMGYIKQPFSSNASDRGSVAGAIGGIVEIRCLAIGAKSSGRTKTIAALLGQELFISSKMITQPGLGMWGVSYGDRQFKLGKTPGPVDPEVEKTAILKVTEHQGPHVILLVLKAPEKEIDVLDFYSPIFGKDLMSHIIIVLMCKKELERKRITVKQYIQSAKGRLRDVLSSVDGHVVAVNPDDKGSLAEYQKRLFRIIKNVNDANHGKHLTIQ